MIAFHSKSRHHYYLLALALLATAALVYVLGNGLFPLIDRDEPRYAQSSRQMLESGDWVTPRYLDELRLKKPILIYWLQAGTMKLLDPTPFAARLPSAIAAVLTLGVFLLTWPRMVGYRRALLGAFIFATMLMPTYLAKVCMTDAVLHFFIAAAMLCLYAVWIGRARGWMLIAMGIALGGSILTKGPPVFLFLGTTLLALWLIGCVTRRDAATHFLSPQVVVPRIFLWTCVIVAIAAGVCFPWVTRLNEAHPGALTHMFLDEVVKRGGEAQEGHSGPPGYYFLTFWVTAFPWCLFWPAAIWHGWKRRHISWIRFSLAAVLGPWLFLEFYQTKLPHYWLPSYPFVALLIADALVRALRGRVRDLGSKPFLIAAGGAAALVSLVGATAILAPSRGDVWTVGSYLAAAGLCLGIIAGAWGVFLLLWRRQLGWATLAMGLSCWAVVTFAWSVFVPATPALNLAKRAGMKLQSLGAVENVRMIEFKEPSLAYYQGGTIREQSEQALPSPQDGADWIVISGEVYDAQSPESQAAYDIVASFRGINVGDGRLQQVVHVLQRKPSPAN